MRASSSRSRPVAAAVALALACLVVGVFALPATAAGASGADPTSSHRGSESRAVRAAGHEPELVSVHRGSDRFALRRVQPSAVAGTWWELVLAIMAVLVVVGASRRRGDGARLGLAARGPPALQFTA